ncbi:MAG: PQQ-binding-like beta-propeller repeat protein [Vicinamibacteria bacterium]|nr:PQQ-binding-like beta-propeller repeat protein [Vicinamibacteria bacterium]
MRLLACAAALAAAACGGVRPAPPPALFPAPTVWLTPLEQPLDGELATDGARIFVPLRDGTLLGLDRLTGERLWSAPPRPGAISAAPGTLLLRQADGRLWSLAPRNGSARWRTDTGITGSLAAVTENRWAFVAGEGLAAVELETGRIVWTAAEKATVTAPPLPWGSWLLVGEQDGTLRLRERETGRTVWTWNVGSPWKAAPAVDDRVLFAGSTAHGFYSLKLDSGDRRWRWKLGADVVAPPVLYGDDAVAFATLENVLWSLERGKGRLVWRAPLPSRPLGGPQLVGGALLIACLEDELRAIDTRTGAKIATMRTPSPLRTAPVVVGDTVYVGLRNPWSIAALRLAGLDPEGRPLPPPPPAPSPAEPAEAEASPSPAPSPRS